MEAHWNHINFSSHNNDFLDRKITTCAIHDYDLLTRNYR